MDADELRAFDPTPTVENIARYLEVTLAGSHPHLAYAYRHAAANVRAVFGGCDTDEPPLVAAGSFTTVAVPGTLPPPEWGD